LQDKMVTLVCDAWSTLGEGPLWDNRTGHLYWVDILEGTLHFYDAGNSGSHNALSIKPFISSIVPRHNGGFALTLQDGFYAFDSSTHQISLLAEAEAHLTDNRFNDGKCDPAGRYLAGTMSLSNQPSRGALYQLDSNHTVKHLLSEVSISNGLAWTSDGETMYYIDTPTRQITAFDYDLATGDVQNRRTVVQIPEDQGYPDGMSIDSEGMIWVAHWGGWQVSRWDPNTGKKLGSIPIPASQVTSCTFGGPNLDQLYITTARAGLSDEDLTKQPLAGGVFQVSAGVNGVPANVFRG